MDDENRTLFMTQVVLPLSATAGYPGHFIELIRTFPARSTPSEKWQLYSYLAGKLIEGLPWMDRGIWDFYGNTAEALSQYADWVDTLEMKEARKQPLPIHPEGYRGPDEKRYIIVCAAFLLDGGSDCSQFVENRVKNMPQGKLWNKTTFDAVFRLFYNLNFAAVASDCAFVLPGDPEYALTDQDLAGPDYSFLRPMIDG